MPSTYAHLRLGREVLRRLEGRDGDVCTAHEDLFLIGLHGPDVLFYYDALHRNPVSAIGFAMHDRPGREFFTHAREAVSETGDAGRAYAYGFACHFALDSEAHPYIEDYIHAHGVAHTAIEGEFDRMLLERDGIEPARAYLAGHISTDADGCAVIARFLPDVTAEQVAKALDDMRRYNRLLVAPGRLKRGLIEHELRKTGNYDDMVGLILRNEPDPRCEESDAALDRIYEGAVDLSLELIGQLGAFFDGGVDDLPPRFDRTFSYMRRRRSGLSDATGPSLRKLLRTISCISSLLSLYDSMTSSALRTHSASYPSSPVTSAGPRAPSDSVSTESTSLTLALHLSDMPGTDLYSEEHLIDSESWRIMNFLSCGSESRSALIIIFCETLAEIIDRPASSSESSLPSTMSRRFLILSRLIARERAASSLLSSDTLYGRTTRLATIATRTPASVNRTLSAASCSDGATSDDAASTRMVKKNSLVSYLSLPTRVYAYPASMPTTRTRSGSHPSRAHASMNAPAPASV